MRTIDYFEALELAKAEIAKEGEDFIYENWDDYGSRYCVYVANGAPSCLVGRILINGGIVEQEVLGSKFHNDELFEGLGDVLADECEVEFTPKASKFLSELQASQDNGITWGDALIDAIESVKFR